MLQDIFSLKVYFKIHKNIVIQFGKFTKTNPQYSKDHKIAPLSFYVFYYIIYPKYNTVKMIMYT